MDELNVTEDFERQIIFVESTKRKEKIKIYVPMTGRAEWKVCYESGKSIPEISGVFLSRKSAIEAVKQWLRNTKISETVKHDLWFGEDQKKQVRTKKRATRAKADNS